MTLDEQSYLLAKAAKEAWRQAGRDREFAVSILARRIADDADLRGYIAEMAIAEISASAPRARVVAAGSA